MKHMMISFLAALALFATGPAMAQSELVDATVESVAGATTVDTAAAKKLFEEGAIFVDLRKDNAYQAGRVPGAVHLEYRTMFSKEALQKVAKADDAVVFYCSGVRCPRSAEACEQALGWGHTKVFYYREGFPGWQQAGLPVE